MPGSRDIRSRSGGPYPPTAAIPLTPQRQWRAFWVCVAVAALTIIDLTKVNVALPSIETALDADSTQLQLIVSGYVLAFGLFLVPMGRLGDQRSRRALFLIGLSLFTLASVGCALAPGSEVLLTARLVQGMAAGMQMPQVIGLIQELFPGDQRGRAFGLFGATIGVATAFGPTLGGLVIGLGGPEDGWRWIFWMNVPLGVTAIALAAWMLPSTRGRSSRPLSLDPVGVVLFGCAVVAFMWPFLFTTGSPDDDPRRWWLLAVFAAFAAVFVLWERRYAARGRRPLIPLSLLAVSSFRNGTLVQTAYFAAMPSMFLLTTLYLQSGLHIEPVYAGMVTVGFALAAAVSSWAGGILVTRYGRSIVVWGLAIMIFCAAGLVFTALFVPDTATPYVMAGVLLFGGIGGGLVIAPNQTLTLAEIPVRQGGVAGSVGQLGQRIGTAVGTAVALALFYAAVYREQGTAAEAAVFHDAYAWGMTTVGGAIALALVAAVVDLGARRRSDGIAPAAPPAPAG